MVKYISVVGVMCLTATLGSFVQAAGLARFEAHVTKILLHDSNYGGCLVYLDNPPNSNGLECSSSVAAVTFDCLGVRTYTEESPKASTATTNSKIAAAQLALVTGNRVKLEVIDTGGQPNGYCYATRIDNYSVP